MFRSTTLKLTGWYLIILMALSLMFSVAIYQMTSMELQARLAQFQSSMQTYHETSDTDPPILEAFRLDEERKAAENIKSELIYTNILILFVGGFVSYYLARRHLAPIERAHDSQSQFTSDASHELRTPLAVMKLELETALRDKSADAASLRQVLSSNLEEVDKLSNLAEMLLNLSRLENSKIKLEAVNIGKITKQVVREFKIPAKRIEISVKKPQIALGNETTITELVRILVDNAIQYSPRDSKILINIYQDHNMARFDISNEGKGIDAEKLPHVFERFFRADSSRTNGERKGYGLGLALAKNIVELHSGTLRVTSAPNATTTFTFLLPCYRDIKKNIRI